MLQSKLFYKTTKEKSADIESISHDLLTRAGFVDQLMAGVYSFLPLGFKVLKNIENIIRKNMIEAGGGRGAVTGQGGDRELVIWGVQFGDNAGGL